MRIGAAFRTVAAFAVLGLSVSGCAAQLSEQARLALELSDAQRDAAAQRAQVAQLESRLAALEHQAAQSTRSQTTRDAPVLARLDHLIRVNERLLERTPEFQPNQAPIETATSSQEPAELASSSAPLSQEELTCGEGLPPEEQLERLVRRIHGRSSGFRGGLSLEQSQALRVLLRRVRDLDETSPWQAAF